MMMSQGSQTPPLPTSRAMKEAFSSSPSKPTFYENGSSRRKKTKTMLTTALSVFSSPSRSSKSLCWCLPGQAARSTHVLLLLVFVIGYHSVSIMNTTQRHITRIDMISSSVILPSLRARSTSRVGLHVPEGILESESLKVSSTIDVFTSEAQEALDPMPPRIKNTAAKTDLKQRLRLQPITNDNSDASFKKKAKRNKKKKIPVRVIYGIASHDMSWDEIKRRTLIRRTFLNYFHDYPTSTITKELNITTKSGNSGDVTTENQQHWKQNHQAEDEERKHWICSLNDLDQGRLEYPDKCRFAYAFVIGGRGNIDGDGGDNSNNTNDNIPTMLLDFNDSYPISLPPPAKANKADGRDCVYLNIKENGKFGKSPTWFRYAVDVLDRHPEWQHGDNPFEYIWKSDTDNLLYTPAFFRFIDSTLPRGVNVEHNVGRNTDDDDDNNNGKLVYGGRPLDYEGCGGDSHDHCSQMVGPIFMAGGAYVLSVNLARFVTNSSAFDHYAVKLPHEDMTTGNFVYSYPNATSKVTLITEPKRKGVIRKHPVKGNKKWRRWWRKMVDREQHRLWRQYYHDHVEASRAVVVVSLGEDVAKSNLVDRFIWSARNRANFQGWIVVLSDAPTGRYTDAIGNLKKIAEVRPNLEHYINKNASSDRDRDLMIQRLKTRVLEYIEDDDRLKNIQVVYVLELDMVFGNTIEPLFAEWEQKYSIGQLTLDGDESGDGDEDDTSDLDGDDDKTTNQKSGHVATDSSFSRIWFFGGNKQTDTPMGQIILQRYSSQTCLERWRDWIDDSGSMSGGGTFIQFMNTSNSVKTSLEVPSCELVVIPEDETKVYTPTNDDVNTRVQIIYATQSVQKVTENRTTEVNSTSTSASKKKKRRHRPENQYPPLVHVRSVASSTSTALTIDSTIHEVFLNDVLNLHSAHQRKRNNLLATPTIIHL